MISYFYWNFDGNVFDIVDKSSMSVSDDHIYVAILTEVIIQRNNSVIFKNFPCDYQSLLTYRNPFLLFDPFL